MVTMTNHATQITRLSGFRFTGTDIHAIVSGSTSARAYVIDNNYFNGTVNDFVDLNANGGLLDHNELFKPPPSGRGPDLFMVHPNENRSQTTHFRNSDNP